MEEEKNIDNLNKDLERHYLPESQLSKWKIDWNMLLYTPEDDTGFKLDWNKLIYNEEQLAEFYLQKNEKIIQPDKYEYLFENPSQRTPMEIHFLKMAGYDVEDNVVDEEEETFIKRLVVSNN